MRLPRPYISLGIRVQVAERQFVEKFGPLPSRKYQADGAWLRALLVWLFGADVDVELHHDPALVNRRHIRNAIGNIVACEPAANDPRYLTYLPKDLHDVRTRLRGERGQYSDLALARKRKRIESKPKRRKTRWPSRPLRSANRWPKRRKP